MRSTRNKGFTLIEIMIVIVIMGIMAAIATPNLMSYMSRLRLNGAARQVMTDLMLARGKAVSENKRVGVVFTSNHQYTIFSDNNQNSAIDTGELTVSKNIQAEFADVTLSSNTSPIFLPNGSVLSATNGTVTLSNTSGSKQVTTSSAGRVRIN